MTIHTYEGGLPHLGAAAAAAAEPSKCTEFTIDRSRMCRAKLADDNGRACSLGQYLLACNVPLYELLNALGYSLAADWLGQMTLEKIWCASDLSPLPDESKIIDLFAQAGVACSFTGEYTAEFAR